MSRILMKILDFPTVQRKHRTILLLLFLEKLAASSQIDEALAMFIRQLAGRRQRHLHLQVRQGLGEYSAQFIPAQSIFFFQKEYLDLAKIQPKENGKFIWRISSINIQGIE